MKFKLPSPSLAALAVAGLLAGANAQAAPIFTTANTDFSGGSTMFGYMGSQFTFSDVSSGGFDPNPVAITTANTDARVTSLALFGPAQPTIFFDPIRGSGSLVFDSSRQYSSFTTATPISFSATPSFIGLALALTDGTHYGYARFSGTNLVSYAFESVAGVGIDAAGAVAAVPEPETLALMLAGLGALGVAVRRRSGKAANPAAR